MDIYLDHAATTPMIEPVQEAMQPFLTEQYGNPASLHERGREAHDAVEEARETVAAVINADPDEIFFTGGATESINTVLKGVVDMFGVSRTQLVTTHIEHKATLRTAQFLKENGADVTYTAVDEDGFVTEDRWRAAVTPKTTLASVIWGNNEIGTMQDLDMISGVCAERDVPLHVDATQVIGKTPVDVEEQGINALSASAHKFHGPKGVGFLYLATDLQSDVTPLLHGGGQEYGMRSGTVNVPGVVGMAAALRYMEEHGTEHRTRLETLAEQFHDALEDGAASLNGASLGKRVPGHLHYTFPGKHGLALLKQLSAEGVYVSTGSACLTGDPSHVLQAIGMDTEAQQSVLRFTFGIGNTEQDVEHAVNALTDCLQ